MFGILKKLLSRDKPAIADTEPVQAQSIAPITNIPLTAEIKSRERSKIIKEALVRDKNGEIVIHNGTAILIVDGLKKALAKKDPLLVAELFSPQEISHMEDSTSEQLRDYLIGQDFSYRHSHPTRKVDKINFFTLADAKKILTEKNEEKMMAQFFAEQFHDCNTEETEVDWDEVDEYIKPLPLHTPLPVNDGTQTAMNRFNDLRTIKPPPKRVTNIDATVTEMEDRVTDLEERLNLLKAKRSGVDISEAETAKPINPAKRPKSPEVVRPPAEYGNADDGVGVWGTGDQSLMAVLKRKGYVEQKVPLQPILPTPQAEPINVTPPVGRFKKMCAGFAGLCDRLLHAGR